MDIVKNSVSNRQYHYWIGSKPSLAQVGKVVVTSKMRFHHPFGVPTHRLENTGLKGGRFLVAGNFCL